MHTAYEYCEQHSIATEADYPYTATDYNQCQDRTITGTVRIRGHTRVHPEDGDLAAAINSGPVAVAVEAGQPPFQFYRSGIVTGPECGTSLNHGVAAVAVYGDHYLVKNSWGAGWGDAGYIRIGREQGEGVCGINKDPSFPSI